MNISTPMRWTFTGGGAATPSGGKRRPMPKVTMSPIALSRMVQSSQIRVFTVVRREVHPALTQDTPPPICGQSA